MEIEEAEEVDYDDWSKLKGKGREVLLWRRQKVRGLLDCCWKNTQIRL